jgi:hypothetical protein
MTLEIKAGVAYRTRGGDRVVLRKIRNEAYLESDKWDYGQDGKVFGNDAHRDDIVALWDEPKEPKPLPTIYDCIALLEHEKDCLTALAKLRTLALQHERGIHD